MTFFNLGLPNARTKTTTVEVGDAQFSQKSQSVQRSEEKFLSVTEVNH